MSLIHGVEISSQETAKTVDGYFNGLMSGFQRDYLESYAHQVDKEHAKIFGWEDLYMFKLNEIGNSDQAADFLAARFLSWAIEGMDNGGDTLYVPASDDHFRLVNDKMRIHLNAFIADRNGANGARYEASPIDWQNQQKYYPYAAGIEVEPIGYIFGRSELSPITALSRDFIFDSAQQKQICGVNYHFKQSV